MEEWLNYLFLFQFPLQSQSSLAVCRLHSLLYACELARWDHTSLLGRVSTQIFERSFGFEAVLHNNQADIALSSLSSVYILLTENSGYSGTHVVDSLYSFRAYYLT